MNLLNCSPDDSLQKKFKVLFKDSLKAMEGKFFRNAANALNQKQQGQGFDKIKAFFLVVSSSFNSHIKLASFKQIKNNN